MEIELECLENGDINEVFYGDNWNVKDGDLINLTLGNRRVVIRIDKEKIAYVVIEEVNAEGQIQNELGEIDLYECNEPPRNLCK